MPVVNIAIDGPAGAGKSTLSKAVSAALGYIYVDTGALYRAVGLHMLRHGIDPKNADAVCAALADVRVSLRFVDGQQRVFLGEEDVSDAIRTPEASMAASDVSAFPPVRDFLFSLQRDIAAESSCIMDGRDIGPVVLPNAEVKVFLTRKKECLPRMRTFWPTSFGGTTTTRTAPSLRCGRRTTPCCSTHPISISTLRLRR